MSPRRMCMSAVQDGYRDFSGLAKRIAERCKIAMPC